MALKVQTINILLRSANDEKQLVTSINETKEIEKRVYIDELNCLTSASTEEGENEKEVLDQKNSAYVYCELNTLFYKKLEA